MSVQVSGFGVGVPVAQASDKIQSIPIPPGSPGALLWAPTPRGSSSSDFSPQGFISLPGACQGDPGGKISSKVLRGHALADADAHQCSEGS